MTKKRLEARRQRNQELARIDAANRCGKCRRALEAGQKRFVRIMASGSVAYCSETCAEESERQ